ncbi:Uncharacterised protein [Klebsiella pneumoniae]|nr:Uncharacterised protein [Klebsiella pneumoniae]
MTSKLTRDRLQEIAEDGFLKHGESKELARMALAAMDSEPDCKERKTFLFNRYDQNEKDNLCLCWDRGCAALSPRRHVTGWYPHQ